MAPPFPDYIELYNIGEKPVNIGQFYLANRFPNSIPRIPPERMGVPILVNGRRVPFSLEPGKKVLVWATTAGFRLAGIGAEINLSHNGEFLALLSNDGVSVIDGVSIPPLEADTSYRRDPEGVGEFSVASNPTPETSKQFPIYSPGVTRLIAIDPPVFDPTAETVVRVWYNKATVSSLRMKYRIEGTEGYVDLHDDGTNGDNVAEDSIACGILGPFEREVTVRIAFEATLPDGTISREPYEADKWYFLLPSYVRGRLLINEIFPGLLVEGIGCGQGFIASGASSSAFIEVINTGVSLEDQHVTITTVVSDLSKGVLFKEGHVRNLGTVLSLIHI